MQGVDRLEILERLRGLGCGDVERVHVRVDEAWHHRASTAIDHVRAAADMRPHLFIRPDGDEQAVSDGQRRGHAKAVVDG